MGLAAAVDDTDAVPDALMDAGAPIDSVAVDVTVRDADAVPDGVAVPSGDAVDDCVE